MTYGGVRGPFWGFLGNWNGMLVRKWSEAEWGLSHILTPLPPICSRDCAPSAFRLPRAVEHWLMAIACVDLLGLWPSIASTAANTTRLRFQPLPYVILAVATGLLHFNELQPRCFSCPPLPLLYRHRRPQKAARCPRRSSRGPMQCSSSA